MEVKATNRETLRFCVDVSRPYSRLLIGGAVCVILGVLVDGVATPLVFADALERIINLKPHDQLWDTFGTLVILYAVLLLIGTVCWRLAGWMEWEGCTKAFSNSVAVSFDRLLELSYRWHVDHPSGEVSSTLSTFSWALMQSIDELTWGMLRIVTGVLAGIIVLLIVAWPVGLTIAVCTSLFVWLVVIRSKPVAEASMRFSAAHTEAEGVAFDVIRNIATVKAQSGEGLERATLAAKLHNSVGADLFARRAFTITRTWMSSIINGDELGRAVHRRRSGLSPRRRGAGRVPDPLLRLGDRRPGDPELSDRALALPCARSRGEARRAGQLVA